MTVLPLDGILRLEGMAPGQPDKETHAQCIKIGTGFACLIRWQVSRIHRWRQCLIDLTRRNGMAEAGQAHGTIQTLNEAPRRQVAMHQAGSVQARQCARAGQCQTQEARHRQG